MIGKIKGMMASAIATKCFDEQTLLKEYRIRLNGDVITHNLRKRYSGFQVAGNSTSFTEINLRKILDVANRYLLLYRLVNEKSSFVIILMFQSAKSEYLNISKELQLRVSGLIIK